MANIITVSLFFLGFLMLATCQNQPCPHQNVRETELVEALAQNLSRINVEPNKIVHLRENIANSNKGLTAAHVKTIMKPFNFIAGRTASIQIMDSFILGLSCKEVVDILGLMTFSAEKLEALEVLKSAIVDIANRDTIINSFNFSSDKEKAKAILLNVRNRSCVWGPILERVAIFLVDGSNSMDAKFTFNGKQYTRFSLVKEELARTIEEQLKPYQQFNVIVFCQGSHSFRNAAVNATIDNIKQGVEFVNKMSLCGGTDMLHGIQTSFSQPGLEANFLLTDGMPMDATPDTILARVKDENNRRRQGGQVPIKFHTTAFLLGSHPSDDKPKARKFMLDMAGATGGAYRDLE
jgi:hypothetical protein